MANAYLAAGVASDGTFWGVDNTNVAFRFIGASGPIPEPSQALVKVELGNAANVWGLDAAGGVYHLINQQPQPISIPHAWHISVGFDGTTFGINEGGGVMRLVNGVWQGVPGSLGQVSVGDANTVWGVKHGSGWYGGPGQPCRFDGTKFVEVPGPEMQWVSVGPDGTIWALTGDPDRQNNATVQYINGNWVTVVAPGPFLWGIAGGPNGNAFAWDVIGALILRNGTWQELPQPPTLGGMAGSMGADGSVCVGGGGQSFVQYRLNGYSTWEQINHFTSFETSSHNAHDIVIGSLYSGYFRFAGSIWQKVNGTLADISVAADGTMWGVDTNGVIYGYDGTNWNVKPGPALAKISCGSGSFVAGIDTSGNIQYLYAGVWTKITSPKVAAMIDVAIGADGTLCVVAADNSAYARVQPLDWVQLPVSLAQIDAADQYHLCGVTPLDSSQKNHLWQGTAGSILDRHAERIAQAARHPRQRPAG